MKTRTVKRPVSASQRRPAPGRSRPSAATGSVLGAGVKRPNSELRPGEGRSSEGRRDKVWQLRLYVAGQTPKSLTAFSNLKKICENHLKNHYHIEVIDLVDQPQLSKGDQILAVPALVRKLPVPVRKIIGDLSDTERVLVGLDLRPAD